MPIVSMVEDWCGRSSRCTTTRLSGGPAAGLPELLSAMPALDVFIAIAHLELDHVPWLWLREHTVIRVAYVTDVRQCKRLDVS